MITNHDDKVTGLLFFMISSRPRLKRGGRMHSRMRANVKIYNSFVDRNIAMMISDELVLE